jgi:Uma2 family endonuclease
MQEARQTYLTPEEYLVLERQAETKSEYLNGEVFAMTGASLAHNQIAVNIVLALGSRLKSGPCRILSHDMRVKVSQTGLYTYPDVVVICGRPQLEDKQKDTLLNPTLLIEVLSPSTEGYDRGAKFAHYRTLESLTDYVLIWQTEARIEHFARQAADKWLLTEYKGQEAVAPLSSIGCELPLAEAYDQVELPPAETATLHILRERQAEYEDEAYARHPPYPNIHR